MPSSRACEFMFTNDTPLTLIRVENGQRNGYWDENEPWKFPPTRINPLDNFRLPLREKETPGITAVVTYKFDLSTVGYHQAIPEQTMTWILNSAEDGDGPNIIKASVHSEGGNHDPSEVLSVNCQTGRAPGSTLPVIVTLHAPTEKIRSQSIVIERISLAEPTRSLFPVVDEKGLSPHFRTSNQPLWTNQHGTIPASIDLTSGNVVYIDVTIRAHPWIHLLVAKISGAPNFFSGNVDIEGNRDSSSIVNTEGIDLATYRCSMKFPVPNTHATISPWGFAKEISWWIVFPMNKGKVTFSARVNPSATVIELYAVSPWLHPSLVKEGIPLQLLRFALLQILDLPQFPTDFAAYITGRVYKDTGFIYDTFHGSPSYMNNDGQFNLHMWLRDFAILHNGMSDAAKYCDYKKFPPTVNCYDQAGILAFCIGLGFPDEKSSKQLFRAYMVPYGFITPTHLVGWPDFETNNPFFRGQKRAASLPPDDENRDPFGNHMFLLYRNKALDACAGPHRGDETLADYIKNAIDLRHKSRTYDSSHDFIVRPDGCAGDVRVRPVLALHDKMDTTIDPIGHVRRIYGQFLIRKTTEANTNHFYIPLDELPDYLQSHLPSPTFTQASGIFKDISKTDYVIVPDPNGVRYGGFLTYSMNYTFNGDGYPVDIDWHVCLSTGAALQVLAQVTSNSTSLTRFKEVLVNGQSFYCTPRSEDRFAMTAFSYGPHTVVLDSHIGTDGLIPIAQSVLAFIKSNEGKDTTNDAFLKQNDDPEKMIPNTSVILKQGEVYTWTTKVTDFMKCDWEYDVGNIFLLEHKLSTNDNSKFTFYARAQGCDAVVITFTNRFMKQVTKKVVFQVD